MLTIKIGCINFFGQNIEKYESSLYGIWVPYVIISWLLKIILKNLKAFWTSSNLHISVKLRTLWTPCPLFPSTIQEVYCEWLPVVMLYLMIRIDLVGKSNLCCFFKWNTSQVMFHNFIFPKLISFSFYITIVLYCHAKIRSHVTLFSVYFILKSTKISFYI